MGSGMAGSLCKKKQKTTVWISEKQINKITFFKFAHNKVRFGPPDVSSKK